MPRTINQNIRAITNQSIIVWTPKTKSLLPSLYKGRNDPSLAKRGEGRFSEEYVFSIMDSLVSRCYSIPNKKVSDTMFVENLH